MSSKYILKLMVMLFLMSCSNNEETPIVEIEINEPIRKEILLQPSVESIQNQNWYVDLIDLKKDTVNLSKEKNIGSSIIFNSNGEIKVSGKYKILYKSSWSLDSNLLNLLF